MLKIKKHILSFSLLKIIQLRDLKSSQYNLECTLNVLLEDKKDDFERSCRN